MTFRFRGIKRSRFIKFMARAKPSQRFHSTALLRTGFLSLAGAFSRRRERIRKLYLETRLAKLCGIRRGQTGEAGSHVVNHIEVAVRPIVVAQTEVGAHGLSVGS